MIFCNSCGSPNIEEACFCNKCGNTIVKIISSDTLKKGATLDGRYEIIELIKAGGMGAVYKAKDTRLDEYCAVKEMYSQHSDPKEQEYAVKRFHQEAKILARLRHLNLPRVIDHFTEHGKYYLVMDFIEGEDLEAIVTGKGKKGLPESKIVKYAIQVLDVLDYLHSQEPPIVYRDVKPPNIIIQKNDDNVMLVDFGIARAVMPGSMTKKTTVGTEGYIAPEQYVGKPEPRSDIYALGATMHHLLTGVTPMIPFHFTPLKELNPEISDKTNSVVMKALEMKPDDRFSSAGEMKKCLEEKYPLPDGSPSPPSLPRPSIQVISKNNGLYRTLPRTSENEGYRTLPKDEKPVYRTLEPKKKGVPQGMVLVPAGEFILGYDGADPGCRPAQKVNLKAFYIDIYPVSNLMYRKFVREKKHKIPYIEGKEYEEYNWNDKRSYPPGKANHPVVLVSWYDAYAYSRWAGKRLPTELEWEKAARGEQGFMYPWGNNWQTGKTNCAIGGIGSTNQRDMFPGDKSPYGVMDMAGNVKEWTADYYFPYSVPYRKSKKKSKFISIRGGSWNDKPNLVPCYLRSRNMAHYKTIHLGFRCVMDAEDD